MSEFKDMAVESMEKRKILETLKALDERLSKTRNEIKRISDNHTRKIRTFQDTLTEDLRSNLQPRYDRLNNLEIAVTLLNKLVKDGELSNKEKTDLEKSISVI